MPMTGKVVVITGAGRGIGAATARIMAHSGARVLLMARDAARLEELVTTLGPDAVAIAGDVARADDMKAAVAAAEERWGRVDVLIANAGVVWPVALLSQADPEEWAAAVDINVKGVLYGISAVLPGMIARGGGTIITLSSGAARRPVPGRSAYSASKAAAEMLTRCVDAENRADGIRAMCLSPGAVITDMQHEIGSTKLGAAHQLDLSNALTPEVPAKALLWMCGVQADDMLGQTVELRDAAMRARIGIS